MRLVFENWLLKILCNNKTSTLLIYRKLLCICWSKDLTTRICCNRHLQNTGRAGVRTSGKPLWGTFSCCAGWAVHGLPRELENHLCSLTPVRRHTTPHLLAETGFLIPQGSAIPCRRGCGHTSHQLFFQVGKYPVSQFRACNLNPKRLDEEMLFHFITRICLRAIHLPRSKYEILCKSWEVSEQTDASSGTLVCRDLSS